MKQLFGRITLAILFLMAFVAGVSAQDCKAKVRIVNFNWNNSSEFRYDQLSANQVEWLNKESKKKFPDICVVTEPGVADYLIAWTTTTQTNTYTYQVPQQSTTQHSGSVSGTTTQIGSGPTYTSGTYSGQSTTTTYSTQQGQWTHSFTNAYVHRLSTEKVEMEVEGKKVMGRKMEKIPVYVSKHKGSFRWSRDDEDALEDAFKFIKKQLK